MLSASLLSVNDAHSLLNYFFMLLCSSVAALSVKTIFRSAFTAKEKKKKTGEKNLSFTSQSASSITESRRPLISISAQLKQVTVLLENHWELLEVFFLNLNREQKQITTKQDKPCIPIPHCKLTVLRKHLMLIFMVHFIFTLHCYE